MVKIVGILNVTPDSFSDGGRYFSFDAAVSHAREMVKFGADIIDIGGVSTRPGSEEISPEDEWKRIEDIVEAVSSFTTVSVDTYRAEVAEMALAKGAKIINDITGGKTQKLLDVVKDFQAKIILMYSRCRTPHDFSHLSQEDSDPDAVFSEVMKEVHLMAERAVGAGIAPENIILDAGIGAFISGNPEVSWEIMRRFDEFKALGYPFMFACSRKSFLKLEGERDIKERDPLSALSGVLVAELWRGAHDLYIRTHNVQMQKTFLDRSSCILGRL
ncbi:MAG: dihydropteroate synthase [Candidatus Dadabacteria bacterium]|nr:MAG: dihydropteroate synthase [Candidatus Dadabacteria bacterium]